MKYEGEQDEEKGWDNSQKQEIEGNGSEVSIQISQKSNKINSNQSNQDL